MKTVVFLLVSAMLSMQAFAQSGKYAEPVGAELEKFPVKNKVLSLAEQAELGLLAKTLTAPVVIQNHFRSIKSGRFVLETLPTGTMVLVDKDGKLRYKADCGNRIVELQKCPQCPVTTSLQVPGLTGIKPINEPKSSWSRFWDAVDQGWGNMWQWLGSIIGFLLPLLLLLTLCALLFYLIYRVVGGREQNPPPPAQVVPPAQPVVPPPAPQAQQGQLHVVPAPAPAPAAQPVAPQPQVVPPPAQPVNQAARPAQAFPANRVVVDLGGEENATRIQAGQNFVRVQYDRNRDDGSATIRIFET